MPDFNLAQATQDLLRRELLAAIVSVALLSPTTASLAAGAEQQSRVRSTDAAMLELLQDGRERSATFRALMEPIDRSNGIVCVQCEYCAFGHLDGHLLPFIASTNRDRYLRISVTPQQGRLSRDELVMVLHLEYAGAPAINLVTAQAEVDRIFRKAGVRVVWTDEPITTLVSSDQSRCGLRHLSLVLSSSHKPERKTDRRASDSVLGQAAPEVGRAYVWVDNLIEATGVRSVDRSLVLGRVMAHELGHLLLPPNSHSTVGIMRSGADFAIADVHVFTDRQAVSIRAGLMTGCPRYSLRWRENRH
jgi:hypothetical protein